MDATIVIPTKNAGDAFDAVLERVFAQETKYQYEVIIVDSGSTDKTLDITRKYPARLIEIPPEDFGHGKTRNFGASQGSGEFIVFITHDALPYDRHWLENLLNAMNMSDDIVGGFGRHEPYPDCNLFDKRDIVLHFNGFGSGDTIYWLDDPERYNSEEGYRHFLSFFSDNNSCLRRSVWEKIPYDDVDFAEDQIWCRKIIEMGYKKVYSPDACVYHSHNYPLKTYFTRFYDEYKGHYEIQQYRIVTSPLKVYPLAAKLTIGDIKYVMAQKSLTLKSKTYWIYYAARKNLYRVRAGYLGGKYHLWSDKKKLKMDKKHSQLYAQMNSK
ncbi:MAG: glycosyltransferase [Oscillospiraceae bacterium]|nr:glycosyltransferase [Oscillospiraceae bacterium]